MGGVYEVDAEEIAILGWSGGSLPTHPRFPATQGLCGAALASRTAVWRRCIGRSEIPHNLRQHPLRDEVPVMAPVGVGVIGLVDVESDRLHAFTDDDRNMMERCATALLSLWDA